MAHPNGEVIREQFVAYQRGDVTAVCRLRAEDVVYHLPGRSPMAGAYQGRDEVLCWPCGTGRRPTWAGSPTASCR